MMERFREELKAAKALKGLPLLLAMQDALEKWEGLHCDYVAAVQRVGRGGWDNGHEPERWTKLFTDIEKYFCCIGVEILRVLSGMAVELGVLPLLFERWAARLEGSLAGQCPWPDGVDAANYGAEVRVGLAELRRALTEPGSADAAKQNPPASKPRKGRLAKAESDAKKAEMLALCSKHSSLMYDLPTLAGRIGVSTDTCRRWLAESDKKYTEIQESRKECDDIANL